MHAWQINQLRTQFFNVLLLHGTIKLYLFEYSYKGGGRQTASTIILVILESGNTHHVIIERIHSCYCQNRLHQCVMFLQITMLQICCTVIFYYTINELTLKGFEKSALHGFMSLKPIDWLDVKPFGHWILFCQSSRIKKF